MKAEGGAHVRHQPCSDIQCVLGTEYLCLAQGETLSFGSGTWCDGGSEAEGLAHNGS